MKIILKNGKEVGIEEIPYITDEGKFIIGKNEVKSWELPSKDVEMFKELYYANYSNLTYIAIRDNGNDMVFQYVIEQELKDNKIIVKNIYSTIEANSEPLSIFFRYNKAYVFNDITETLTKILNKAIGYLINTNLLKDQLGEALIRNERVVVETNDKPIIETPIKKEFLEKGLKATKGKDKIDPKAINLKQIAEETGIKYNTLWNRIHRTGMTLEEAVSRKKKGVWNK